MATFISSWLMMVQCFVIGQCLNVTDHASTRLTALESRLSLLESRVSQCGKCEGVKRVLKFYTLHNSFTEIFFFSFGLS